VQSVVFQLNKFSVTLYLSGRKRLIGSERTQYLKMQVVFNSLGYVNRLAAVEKSRRINVPDNTHWDFNRINAKDICVSRRDAKPGTIYSP
jgi:hypothetical protein